MKNFFNKKVVKPGEFDDTTTIDTSAIVDAIKKKKKYSIFRNTKITPKRLWIIIISSVLIITIISASVFGIMHIINPLMGYAQAAATKTNISYTIDTEGTLSVGNHHYITSLVAGKVIASDFEVGDEVKAGDELYKLDDTEAKLAVEKAKNELDKSGDTSYNSTVARISSTESGILQTLNIREGSIVTPGTVIGTIKKNDDSISSIVAYMSGKVIVLSARVGQSLSVGQIIASVNTSSNSTSSSEYDKKNSEIDLQAAQRHLENFSIKSPVSGIIVEKNINAGDNVGATDTSRPMMVIVDTNNLNFSFQVDEYQLRDMRKGQSAEVSVASIPDTIFSGRVSAISNEGKTDDNGNLLFDITVTIDKPGDLKAGMSVRATVTLASVKKVISVPQKALIESNGQDAFVFVKYETDDPDDPVIADSLELELEYPWIKVPDNCILVNVKYGISNGEFVQIMSGLKAGEIVVYDPSDKNNTFIKTTKDIDDFIEKKENKLPSTKQDSLIPETAAPNAPTTQVVEEKQNIA